MKTFFLILLIVSTGCAHKTRTVNASEEYVPPTVEFVGVYHELNVSKRGDPVYAGRVFIEGTDVSVLLETGDEGIRPQSEIDTFRDQEVIVGAKGHDPSCTAWGDGTEASIVMDCLRGVISFRLKPD